jgi:hypothetical protein
MNLEQDIEPFLESNICNNYWHSPSDHKIFREIINAIDAGGGQSCNVPGVLRELHKAGFVIKLK